VIAVAGDDLVTRAARRGDADGDRLLADVEVTEPADQAHAVELPRPLLEAADPQHFAIVAAPGLKTALPSGLGHGSPLAEIVR
jgi:hypothetical protein